MTGALNRERIRRECREARPTVAALPYYYAVHLNEPCNQRCIMCVPSGRHGRRVLSYEGFVALFDRVKAAAEHITLIGGETLMYPQIREVLALLARHPIAVTINTNATMLTDRVVPSLMALHELHLKCSIDGATRETYHRIRGTDVFDRVTRNIRRFSGLIVGRPHVRLILVYVVMRENLHEVLPFIDFARGLCLDRVEFHPVRHVHDWRVENGTGWTLDGRDQSCESFRDEYNDVMRRVAERCEALGLGYEAPTI